MSSREPWWQTRRREQTEHASRVHTAAWRAGLGDQHPDDIARAFDNGVSPDRFVRERVEARERERREQEERAEEQRRLESTCAYEDRGGPCWGYVDCAGYDGPDVDATPMYACRGHADMPSAGIYTSEDGEQVEVDAAEGSSAPG